MLAMYVAACLRDLEGETKTNEKAVTMTTEGDVLTTRDLEATSVSTSMPKIRLMRSTIILFLPFVTSALTHHPSFRLVHLSCALLFPPSSGVAAHQGIRESISSQPPRFYRRT